MDCSAMPNAILLLAPSEIDPASANGAMRAVPAMFPEPLRRRFRRHGKGARASPNSDAIRVLIGDGGRRGYPRQAGMTSGMLADTRDDADATNADACYAVTTLAAVQSHRWTHIAGYTWAVHMAERTGLAGYTAGQGRATGRFGGGGELQRRPEFGGAARANGDFLGVPLLRQACARGRGRVG